MPQQLGASMIKSNAFNLCPTEIDSDSHCVGITSRFKGHVAIRLPLLRASVLATRLRSKDLHQTTQQSLRVELVLVPTYQFHWNPRAATFQLHVL